MPLPTATTIAPMTDDEAARPEWLRGAPDVAISAWSMVAGLGHGEGLSEADILTALGLGGRLPPEVSSTLVATGLQRQLDGGGTAGAYVAVWRRPPWRAPRPCPRCRRGPA